MRRIDAYYVHSGLEKAAYKFFVGAEIRQRGYDLGFLLSPTYSFLLNYIVSNQNYTWNPESASIRSFSAIRSRTNPLRTSTRQTELASFRISSVVIRKRTLRRAENPENIHSTGSAPTIPSQTNGTKGTPSSFLLTKNSEKPGYTPQDPPIRIEFTHISHPSESRDDPGAENKFSYPPGFGYLCRRQDAVRQFSRTSSHNCSRLSLSL